MKKLLLTFALAMAIANPAYAELFGLDWESTGEYNVDTEVTSLTAQVGKSILLNGLTLTADADYDIIGSSFSGTDYKASFDVSDNLEMYLSTGLDSTWTREDLVAGFKVTW